MKRVHLYVVTRVAIDVELTDDIEAIKEAINQFNQDQKGYVRDSEYADEIQEALVDTLDSNGQCQYEISKAYTFDMGEIKPA